MEKVGEQIREKILVLQKGRSAYRGAADLLSRHGYATATIEHDLRAPDKVAEASPELILFENIAFDELSASLCAQLKGDRFTRHIPLVVSGTRTSVERLEWLRNQADLCLDVFAPQDEFLSRIGALLRRSVEYDPLTRLPTVGYLHPQLNARLAKNLPTAALYVHIDDFSTFAEACGQEAANRALQKLASLIVEALPPGNLSVARIPDEDFMIVIQPKEAETVAQTLVDRFRAARLGCPEGNGSALTLSAALVTNRRRPLTNYIQVTARLSALMRQVQARGGDHWERDDHY